MAREQKAGPGLPTGIETPSTSGLKGLLVELGRAFKAVRFYAVDHPARRDAADRAFLAWRVETERRGRLELFTDVEGFRLAENGEPVPPEHLGDLAEALLDKGADHLVFTTELSRKSFTALLEVLALDERAIARRGGFETAFAKMPHEGIGLGSAPRPGPHPSQRSAPGADGIPSEGGAVPTGIEESPGQPSSERFASLGSALLSAKPDEEAPDEDATKPSLEEDPLLAPPTDEADEGLLRLLRELDACTDDEGYRDLAQAVSDEAARLFSAGHQLASYRAMLVLADHAVGQGGRSGVQLRCASESLGELCRGTRLETVIERACASEGSVSVRAAQLLLQLGGRAVAPVLDRLEAVPDDARRARLSAVVVALGERSVPILVSAMRGDDSARARAAVRLAGELQSPHVVPILSGLLEGASAGLRREAARALAQIGSERALARLRSALRSSLEGLPEIAAACLGEVRDTASLRALLERLEEVQDRPRQRPATEIVRALGRIGSEEAVPKLVSLVERRPWLHRRERLELRTTALEALARIPSREALRCLRRAATGRDPKLREVAERALARSEQTAGAQ